MPEPNGLTVSAKEQAGQSWQDEFDAVPVAVGRRPNGDIIGNPMLAHKASHEGHVAAKVIAGHKVTFEPRVIPSIAYTNPEIAWAGLTEQEAKAKGLAVATAVYPWSVSGRALAAGRAEGKTKLIYDAAKGTLLGAGIVGKQAGDLLGERCPCWLRLNRHARRKIGLRHAESSCIRAETSLRLKPARSIACC